MLLRRFGYREECFVSPFNSRYRRYESLFGDTDGVFGSRGSFSDKGDGGNVEGGSGDVYGRGGGVQANPSFAANFIEAMYERIERLSTRGEEGERRHHRPHHLR